MRYAAALAFCLFGAAASASAISWWMPLREVATQMYVAHDGPAARYMWRYVVDRRDEQTCVLILTDQQTGHFAITAVPAASCR